MKNKAKHLLTVGILIFVLSSFDNYKTTRASINRKQQNSSTQIKTKTNEISKKVKGNLAGTHNLTLQWISWKVPGKITFTSIGNNSYQVEGYQKASKSTTECAGCYLKIKGTVVKITSKILRFTGKIESAVSYIQNGKPCIKEGTFDFVASGKRKYWRCQKMDGCAGVTDYVDIYFR